MEPLKELLSDRERQIARLGARGLTDKEIAEKLSVSITTVRTYWVRLRRKLRATNRAQAIVHALREEDRDYIRDAASRLVDQSWLGIGVLDACDRLVESNQAFLDMAGDNIEAIAQGNKPDGRMRPLLLQRAGGALATLWCTILPLGKEGQFRAAYLLPRLSAS